MQRRELADLPAGPAEAREHLFRRMIDDADFAVHAVDHVDELLRRIGREYEIVDRAVAECRLLEDMLGHERAVFAEDMQAVIRPIADVDQPVLVNADAMHRLPELACWRLRRIVARLLLVAGP